MTRPAIDLEADIQPVSDFRANTSSMLEYQAPMEELDTLRDVQCEPASSSKSTTLAREP